MPTHRPGSPRHTRRLVPCGTAGNGTPGWAATPTRRESSRHHRDSCLCTPCVLQRLTRCWLRPVVAFDDDEVDRRNGKPQLDCFLVFRRLPAVEGRLVRRKLDHDIARAAGAFGILETACTHAELRAELPERLGVGGDVGLVLLRVGNIDSRDPVALWHVVLLLWCLDSV